MATVTYPGKFAVVNEVRSVSVNQCAESKTVFEAVNNNAITLNYIFICVPKIINDNGISPVQKFSWARKQNIIIKGRSREMIGYPKL